MRTGRRKAQALAGHAQLTLHVAVGQREQWFVITLARGPSLETGVQCLGNVDNPLEAAFAHQEQPTLAEQTVRDKVMIAAMSCANELANTCSCCQLKDEHRFR